MNATLSFSQEAAIAFCKTLKWYELKEFAATSDKLLWIEYNVLDPLELPGISTRLGMHVAEAVEDWLASQSWYKEPRHA